MSGGQNGLPREPLDRAIMCLRFEHGSNAVGPAPENPDLIRSPCPVHSHRPGDRPLTIRAVGSLSGYLRYECEAGCLSSVIDEEVRRLEEKWLASGTNGAGDAEEGAGRNGRGKLRRLDLVRMAREKPPPVPWIVEGLVVRGMLTVLAGREGEGKSLLAQALAAGVATGQDEAGLGCHRGRALIVDAENGEYEIWRRVHTLGLEPADMEIYEAEGFDLRTDLHELERVLKDHQPDFLVLDSYRSLWSGKENDSGEVAAGLDPLRNLVRRLGAGTLLLHHSSRATGEYRGNSAIGASAELGFKLAKADDDPERRWRRYLDTWKCRPAPEPPRRWLRLAVERGEVFVDQAEPFEDETGAAETSAPVREELRPRILAALDKGAQRRADLARALNRKPDDRSVGRVLKNLERDGEAEQTAEGWWRRLAGATGPIGGCQPANPPVNTHSDAENGSGRGVAKEWPCQDRRGRGSGAEDEPARATRAALRRMNKLAAEGREQEAEALYAEAEAAERLRER